MARFGGREGSVFPNLTSNPGAINGQRQAVLDDTLGNVTSTSPNKYGGLDYYGARFDSAGNLVGLLEP
jgi:hypothetical protein